MKFEIARHHMSLALSRLGGAFSDKSSAYIGIRASLDQLIFTSSDQVMAIYVNAHGAKIEEGGCLFIPAKACYDVIKELPNTQLYFSLLDNFLTIKTGDEISFSMRIPIIEEYLWREKQDFSENKTAFNAVQLKYQIDQIQYCTHHEFDKAYGTVAFFCQAEPGVLLAVGTDGYRLVLSKAACDVAPEILKSGIVFSKKALMEIYKMTSEGHELIKFSHCEKTHTVKVWVEDYEIFILLSNVRYPNFDAVLPRSAATKVVANRVGILEAIRRALLSSGKTRSLHLMVDPSGITLTASDLVGAKSSELFMVDSFEGPPVECTLNGKYFSDLLSVITDERVHMSLGDSETPLKIQPVNEKEGYETLHVIVPIKEGG